MNDSSTSDGRSPEMERAEEMVDAMTQSLASWAARLGRRIAKTGALAREEADDIWAEAQHLRRGRQP